MTYYLKIKSIKFWSCQYFDWYAFHPDTKVYK